MYSSSRQIVYHLVVTYMNQKTDDGRVSTWAHWPGIDVTTTRSHGASTVQQVQPEMKDAAAESCVSMFTL